MRRFRGILRLYKQEGPNPPWPQRPEEYPMLSDFHAGTPQDDPEADSDTLILIDSEGEIVIWQEVLEDLGILQ